MTTDLAIQDTAAMLERLVVDGDCSKLTPEQKVKHYVATCDSLNLNWRTKPFAYLRLNGKEILYAQRDCTDQLRKQNGVSIVSLERERIDELYMVTATAKLPDGRTDSAIGAVPIAGLKGEALANAFMKAETKAKRRVTLSICGLGMTDESEVGSIPGAQTIEMDALPATVERNGENVNTTPGEITEKPKAKRTRAEIEARYAELCDEARMWNDSERGPVVEFLTFKPDWTDDQITASGLALSKALDQVAPKERVPA